MYIKNNVCKTKTLYLILKPDEIWCGAFLLTNIYKYPLFTDFQLLVLVTHPSGRWWSRSPGCAPFSPSPAPPAGWCIPSPGSACCAPAGSICPAAHARWLPAAAAACCSLSGFYGASSPPRTRLAAMCWLLPADGEKKKEKKKKKLSQQFYLVTHHFSIW